MWIVAGVWLGATACDVNFGPCGLFGCGDGGAGSGGGGVESPVSEIEVLPRGYALVVGEVVKLSAYAHCPPTGVCPNFGFGWQSSQPAVATVSEGFVTAVGRGIAHIVVTGAGRFDSSEIHVGSAYRRLDHIGAGGQCALADAGAAYCWGSIAFSSPDSDFGLDRAPRRVAGNLSFVAISNGATLACGLTAGGQVYCWGSSSPLKSSQQPTLLDGTRTFRSVSVGTSLNLGHLCTVATDGAAFCLGANDYGQLGNDSTSMTCAGSPCSDTLVPVSGALLFSVIRAGDTHTCALTPGGMTYCWGANFWGQRGDTSFTSRSTPGPVVDAPPFVALATTSQESTCGLTSDGAVFCWGRNDRGQLGLGTVENVPHPVPTRITAAGVAFNWLDAGTFTCAGANDGGVYCWGHSINGVTFLPTRVVGGPPFNSVGVDQSAYACATGADGRGYYWMLGSSPGALFGPIEP